MLNDKEQNVWRRDDVQVRGGGWRVTDDDGRPLQIPSGLAGAPSHVPEQQPPAILGSLRHCLYLLTITLHLCNPLEVLCKEIECSGSMSSLLFCVSIERESSQSMFHELTLGNSRIAFLSSR